MNSIIPAIAGRGGGPSPEEDVGGLVGVDQVEGADSGRCGLALRVKPRRQTKDVVRVAPLPHRRYGRRG